MSNLPIDPNLIPLLRGVHPYLGSKGKVVTDSILSLVDVVTSPHGQNAAETISRAFTTYGVNDRMITVNTRKGPVTLSLNNAFTLFLILILLILSGNLLAFSESMYSASPDSAEEPDSGYENLAV
ncbi:MAG: hypothetical protein CVU89_14035 [Firmicutes bacterium HGW-Firmicutes-14]|jgi:hypothetical protein|nr:MAG: hypothetical protein CVU89_14035 [Firmicutes bacterium HGW-Firmicutes-14]